MPFNFQMGFIPLCEMPERRFFIFKCWQYHIIYVAVCKLSKMDYYDFDDNNYYDNDEYDEFLFSSIKRYNVLQMFNLENIPQQIFQMDDSSVCVVSRRINGENSEILKLRIPQKLTLPPELESRSKDNDFKVISGHFTDGLVSKADKLSSDKVIISQQNKSGFVIYDMALDTESSLDNESMCGSDFVVLKEPQSLITYKTLQEPLTQLDINVGAKLKEIKHPFQKFNTEKNNKNDVICCIVDNNLLAILNTYTGDTVLHDLRINENFINLPSVKSKNDKEMWGLCSYDYNPSGISYFGLVSDCKSVCVYEKRTNTIVSESSGDETGSGNVKNLKLKFSEMNDQFSISGLSSFVEIYKINKDDCHHLFTHNGHCPSNSTKHIVTDHIWLKANNKEFVFSICDNRTLNCWDFNVS